MNLWIAILTLSMLTVMNTEYQRAMALFREGRAEDSLVHFERAIAQSPDDHKAWCQYGVALVYSSRTADGMKAFCRSLGIADLPYNRVRMGCMMLFVGMWEEGWKNYESRLSEKPLIWPHNPWWDGSPVNSLVVYSEQGWGDRFQFLRYYVLAKQQYPDVQFFAATPPYTPEAYTSLQSLPLAMRLYRPEQSPRPPYVFAEPEAIEKWSPVIRSIPGFKVGICWQGNPKYPFDSTRSIPLRYFLPLRDVPNVMLCSLQKYHGWEQLVGINRLLKFGHRLDTGPDHFVDTCAVVSQMDLVITSDTAMAHIAGAMGKPVWLALSTLPEWRWGLKGETTPWYPTMRLFRQGKPEDWRGVFESIETDLRRLVG